MGYRRSDRVADLIRVEIASMLLRGEVKDPRIGVVTITKVRMTPDLKSATIFFSIIGDKEEVERCLEGLRSASGYMRKALAKHLRLRHVPSITFRFDDSLEYASHIEKVIKDMHG